MVEIFAYTIKICAKHFTYRNIPDCTVYTATERIGLLSISPPKRSDFRSADRIGLPRRCVNNTPNPV